MPSSNLRAVLTGWLHRSLDDVRRAGADKNVRRGAYGTLLIALGALSPAYLPRTSPWWQVANQLGMVNSFGRTLGTVMTMAGLFLLVDSWFRLRPRPSVDNQHRFAYHHLRHWAILLIWSIPFLLAPPIFSHDAYSYAAQGWLIHNGINPYDAGPSILPGAFTDQVSWVWRDTPAPYGPLSLQLQHLIVVLCGFRPYSSAVAMRILALIGVAIIGILVPRVARQRKANPAVAAWFATLNPVLVVDFIGGAHNDCLMLAFIILALWVTGWPVPEKPLRLGKKIFNWTRFGSPWWLLGAVLIGIGAAVKQPAIMAAYALPLMTRPWLNFSIKETSITALRVLISFAVAVASFSLVSWATGLGFGWLNAVNVPGRVITIAPFTVIGQGIQLILNYFRLDPSGWAAITASRTAGVIIAGIVISVLAVTVARRRPVRFLALAYLVAALALPAVRSWYILWGGLILPMAKVRRRTLIAAIWVTIVLLCYDGMNMAWRNNAMALGFALAVGIGILAKLSLRQHARQRKMAAQLLGEEND